MHSRLLASVDRRLRGLDAESRLHDWIGSGSFRTGTGIFLMSVWKMDRQMLRRMILIALLFAHAGLWQSPLLTSGVVADEPGRLRLVARASEISPQAREYPELGYVFSDENGKPADLQYAAVNTDCEQRGELVIWLMANNGPLFETLAGMGFHAIQVRYANRWFGLIPADVRDSGTALGDIRLEAATGADHSAVVQIDVADGMQQRALSFVRHLAQQQPAAGWEQYLAKGGADLNWEKVVIAGISHGSTTAARFAKHQKVGRVVMFSGPRDQLESWQSLPSATPASRYFGFTHVLDTGWTGDHYCRSWLMLGLHQFGPLVDVEEAALPYGSSRRLITRVDVGGDAGRAHGMVVPGRTAARRADGSYLHDRVWEYLFTYPVDRTGDPVSAEPDCRNVPAER